MNYYYYPISVPLVRYTWLSHSLCASLYISIFEDKKGATGARSVSISLVRNGQASLQVLSPQGDKRWPQGDKRWPQGDKICRNMSFSQRDSVLAAVSSRSVVPTLRVVAAVSSLSVVPTLSSHQRCVFFHCAFESLPHYRHVPACPLCADRTKESTGLYCLLGYLMSTVHLCTWPVSIAVSGQRHTKHTAWSVWWSNTQHDQKVQHTSWSVWWSNTHYQSNSSTHIMISLVVQHTLSV